MPDLLAPPTPEQLRAAEARVRQMSMFGVSIDYMREMAEEALKLEEPAMLAMSMISGAQEEINMGLNEEARHTLNRAKWVLANYVLRPRE